MTASRIEAGLTVPLGYVGLTDSRTIAIEYDEFGDRRLAASIAAAEAAVDDLVDTLSGTGGGVAPAA